MKIIIPTEPQNIPNVIKTGLLIWKHILNKTIPFSLIFITLNSILVAVLGDKINNYSLDQFSLNLLFSKSNLLLGSMIIIYAIVFATTNAGMIYIVNKTIHNESVLFNQAVAKGFKKAFSQLLIFILYLMIATIGPCLLFILLLSIPKIITTFASKSIIYLCCILFFTPGMIILVYFMFAMYLAIIEEHSVINSIKNSFKLVSGNWWHTLGAFLTINSISSVCSLLLNKFSAKVVTIIMSTEHNLCINFFLKNSLSTIFITPLTYAFIMAMLYNLQAKKRCTLEL